MLISPQRLSPSPLLHNKLYTIFWETKSNDIFRWFAILHTLEWLQVKEHIVQIDRWFFSPYIPYPDQGSDVPLLIPSSYHSAPVSRPLLSCSIYPASRLLISKNLSQDRTPAFCICNCSYWIALNWSRHLFFFAILNSFSENFHLPPNIEYPFFP